jgi:hypothetical protein
MSTLLEQASLVLIPSGYKEDIVYSQIPTSGAGDLSFTRASNGTRVNSAGLVEVCPWNLVQYSEDIANAAWGKNNVTVTSNAIAAPNGTTTADLISATANVGFVDSANFTLTVNSYTITMYAKKSNVDWVSIEISDGIANNTKSWYNINTGVLGTTGGTMTIVSRSIESVGNGWYRLILTTNVTPVTNPYRFIPFFVASDGALSSSGNAGYAWGAQVNIGSTAKPYFPTTDRLNVPRLTYQNGGGGCPSLLLEKQSTNLATYSEDITQWSGSLSVTANDTISPDGTQNADKITSSSSTASKYRFFSGNANCTISIFAKKVDTDWILISFGQPSTYYAIFRFSDGVCTKAVSGITTTSTNYGNGWWRFTMSTTSQSIGYIELYPNNNATNYGYSSGSCYIWGAQYEDLTSYPTSYIPTTSASATRVADVAQKTGISSLIGQTEGTLFVDFTINALANFGTPLSVNDGSTANYIWLTIFANGNLRAELFNSSGVQATITYSGAVVGGRYKMAFAYKTNDFAMYVNGSQVGIATSGTTFSGTTLSRIDNDITSPALYSLASQSINQSALFKTRLTNAELASLTTI